MLALAGLASIKDSGCTFTVGYFLRRPTSRSKRWSVVLNEPDSAQPCSYFKSRVPSRVLREFAITGVTGPKGGVGLCANADVARRAGSARALATTAPVEAAGPNDPAGGAFGLVRPRRFAIVVVPFSWGFLTADTRWRGWGSPTATGTGTARFSVIMTTGQKVAFTLILSRRQFVACAGRRSHYSYEKQTVHMPDYRGSAENFSVPMHAGCRQLSDAPA